MEAAWINGSIVAISPFRVDIQLSSQRVGFGAQLPRTEVDNKIELGKVFGPTGLSLGKDLCHGEVLKVLMIHDHINQSTGTFEVVSPDTESIEDHQHFFVVSVIVEFQCTESAGMEGHGVDFTGIGLDGENGAKGIVQGVSLNNDQMVRNPVGEDRCRGERRLQGFKRFPSGVGEIPWSTFSGKPG